jgi:hypothetical protein
MKARAKRFRNLAEGGILDVLIVGGGISGAPLYQILSRRGYRVALIDKGDFASGTSQASGMLIWGGLLYLRNLEFSTVVKLCKARKSLLKRFSKDTAPLDLHYLAGDHGARSIMVRAALQLYWLLGGCELRRPGFRKSPSGNAHVYQEGMLRSSDSRFVVERIAGHDSEHCIPLNHCRLVNASYDPSAAVWRIDLTDEVSGSEHHVRARVFINTAGVWADELNRLAGLESPYKHVFSKGVYLAFPRNGEKEARVHPMRGRSDVLTHVPWGPVMMWGPTETSIQILEPRSNTGSRGYPVPAGSGAPLPARASWRGGRGFHPLRGASTRGAAEFQPRRLSARSFAQTSCGRAPRKERALTLRRKTHLQRGCGGTCGGSAETMDFPETQPSCNEMWRTGGPRSQEPRPCVCHTGMGARSGILPDARRLSPPPHQHRAMDAAHGSGI